MRALSVAQPWAECIVAHGKNVENRTWNTRMRGYFAIHASKTRDLGRFRDCDLAIEPDEVLYGAIVGVARLADVITRRGVTSRTRRWFVGTHGLVLDDVIRLRAPVPATGGLGFWRVKPRTLHRCLAELSAAERARIERGPVLGEPGTRTWIVKGRIDWNGHDFVRAGRTARWVTRKPPKEWSPGDTILFWKGRPYLSVVAAGCILRCDERDAKGNAYFRVKYLTRELATPVDMEALRRDCVVGHATFLKSGPAGTVFPLSDAESRRIATIALARNRSSMAAADRRIFQGIADGA